METIGSNATMTETRQRLLEAAGEVFAERGFRATTVREICHRAKANLAAVNYHFGDKERLYAAVLQYTFRYAIEKYPLDLGLGAEATAEERLQAFIRSHLFGFLDEGLPAWHGKLMAREMAEPTGMLDTLVEPMIRPKAELLWASTRELLNIFHAEESNCDIITVPNEFLSKLDLVDKDLAEYSRETVQLFYRDATAAAYQIKTTRVAAE